MPDQRSPIAHAYRTLYKSAAWLKLRRSHLLGEPLCRMCTRDGRTTAAAIVDHVTPHRGSTDLFFDPENLQSLCKHHHDSEKQELERRGYSTAIGSDGFPVDPNHPANR